MYMRTENTPRCELTARTKIEARVCLVNQPHGDVIQCFVHCTSQLGTYLIRQQLLYLGSISSSHELDDTKCGFSGSSYFSLLLSHLSQALRGSTAFDIAVLAARNLGLSFDEVTLQIKSV